MKILITGGAGYIGSHTVLECLLQNHEVVVLDNLCNSSRESLNRVEKITGRPISFYQGGIEDRALLRGLFSQHVIEAVIHFAALKAVGESCQKPLLYHTNNVTGTLVLLEEMQSAGVSKMIFSSSATVYGNPEKTPVDETMSLQPMSPYGSTKCIIEQILQDLAQYQAPFQAVLLRYFNPIGAHPSGEIGEDPRGIPNNLCPYLTQVAVGKRSELAIFGQDYDTPDGTCIRDYIHVMDIARGHLAALNALPHLPACSIYNLGTGRGYSVLEVIQAFEAVIGRKIPYRFVERRAGDIPQIYASVDKAKRDLAWEAEYDLDAMLRDAWKWQTKNLKGY